MVFGGFNFVKPRGYLIKGERLSIKNTFILIRSGFAIGLGGDKSDSSENALL